MLVLALFLPVSFPLSQPVSRTAVVYSRKPYRTVPLQVPTERMLHPIRRQHPSTPPVKPIKPVWQAIVSYFPWLPHHTSPSFSRPHTSAPHPSSFFPSFRRLVRFPFPPTTTISSAKTFIGLDNSCFRSSRAITTDVRPRVLRNSGPPKPSPMPL
ncbi:hypothetical protein F4801DRAFT_6013 [Xylaria longipes]|nr:hypothetical protein F4801DRAFT_6013 [Xylaria longipes]